MEDWPTARRHFRRAARLQPRRGRNWLRVAVAHVPPLGRRAWGRHGSLTYPPSTVGVPVQTEGRSSPERELFLAWGYRENPGVSEGDDGSATAGRPPPPIAPAVRRLAHRLSRRIPDLLSLQLSLGLERDPDPVARLQGVARDAGGAPTLLAVTDRARGDPGRPFGPPSNPDHRREWTGDQFRLLLRSTGFRVERTWRRGTQRVFLVRGMDEPPTRIN
jgi:hypothetical protein